MQIAIDASRTTAARVTGTERYALELVRALIRLNDAQSTPHTLHLFFRDAPTPDLFPDSTHVEQHVIPLPRLWTHIGWAAALWRAALMGRRYDVVWSPAHTLPFLFPGRAAATVHDLGFRHFPDAHPPRQRQMLNLTTRASSHRASLILADSQATRDDLIRFYGTPEGKIRVVYPGVQVPAIGDSDAVRQKYHLPASYLLFLGTLQPRKNISRLVAAYAQARAQSGDDFPGLILAGGRGWLYTPEWTRDVPGVHEIGYVDDSERGALYAGAVAFVFPSLYEGFGFPVLEAMGCGTPVLCSNTSSLPELAGDAACLVDPTSTAAIAGGLIRLAADSALRADLIARGHSRVPLFTWDKAAAAAMAALEKAAHG